MLRPVAVAKRGARAVGVEVPAPAANHVSIAIECILAPFPDVAVHVVEAPRVRAKRAGGDGAAAVLARRLSGQRVAAVVVRVGGGEGAAERIRRRRAGPARVLPLGLGGEAKAALAGPVREAEGSL